MKQKLLATFALATVVFAVHFPALEAGFVWDDNALVLRDPLIRSWRNVPEQFQHFLFTDATPSNFYRPIQRMSYTLEYALGVFRPQLYHFGNLLFHSGAVLALFFFAFAWLKAFWLSERRSFWVSFVAALSWAAHPLHSAVVDYVAGRADSLAAMFGFLGLYVVVRTISAPSWRLSVIAGIFLLASALSKESGLIFVVLAAVLGFTRREKRTLRQIAITSAFVVTIYFTLRLQAGEAVIPQLTPSAPWSARPIVALRALAEYAGLTVAPINLYMDRDVESHPWGMSPESMTQTSKEELITIAGVLLVLGIGWWMWCAWRRHRPLFVLLASAALAYLPISALWPLNATMAEHWIYVPSAFLFLAATGQATEWLERKAVRQGAMACALAWIVVLAGRSLMRASDWHDDRTFFERTIAAGGSSPRMLINLGAVDLRENKLGAARQLFARALAKQPDQPFAILNLGIVALKENDFAGAHQWVAQAQKHEITAAQAHEIAAVVRFREKAEVDLLRLRVAARTAPPTWSIERRYVESLAQQGMMSRAIEELKNVLRAEPYRAETWQLLAGCFSLAGDRQNAEVAMAQARDLDVHLEKHPVL